MVSSSIKFIFKIICYDITDILRINLSINTKFIIAWVCVCSVASVMSAFLQPPGLQPTRILCPLDFPDKNTVVGCHFLLQGIFLIQGLNQCLLHLLHCTQILYHWTTREAPWLLTCNFIHEKLGENSNPGTQESTNPTQRHTTQKYIICPLAWIKETKK